MPEPAPITVAAFAGSLRKGSYNKSLLRAAVKHAPAGVRVDAIDIQEVPLYDADVEAAGLPPAVQRLRDTIRAADALLIVSPEYNYSMSGVTKNVLDWASRPPDDASLDDKPVALAGCSPGYFGTIRSKIALLPILWGNNMHVLDEHLNVSRAKSRFDDAGELTDEDTKRELVELLEALAARTRRLKST